jgi:imidazolonepropionase-like amidohydrolase
MPMHIFFRRLCATLIFLSLPCFAQDNTVVLQNVAIVNPGSEQASAPASIVIRAGKIARIDRTHKLNIEGARVIDLTGKVVMPGLINGHGHLGLAQGINSGPQVYTEANIKAQLAQYERYGVTTMLSLGMNRDMLYEIRANAAKNPAAEGATIFTADRGFGVPEGMPPVKVTSDQIYRPSAPEEARSEVRETAARHPDLVKIWIDDNLHKLPEPNQAVYSAIIDEAHKQRLRVAAHVYYLEDVKRLLKDKIDILAHSVRDAEIDDETIATMKRQHVIYIPTLQLEESFYIYADHPSWMDTTFFQTAAGARRFQLFTSAEFREKVTSDPTTAVHRQAFDMALRNAKKLSDAGVTLGFGTDSGANPNRIQGWAEHRELELMVQAGLTPAQALLAATATNAGMLRMSTHIGSIRVGMNADLLVLDADPLANILNTRKIALVLHNGREAESE